MTITRGEIWRADLDPTQGSEQAGFRPVLVMQNNAINRSTTTVLCIPLTGNLRPVTRTLRSVRVTSGQVSSAARLTRRS